MRVMEDGRQEVILALLKRVPSRDVWQPGLMRRSQHLHSFDLTFSTPVRLSRNILLNSLIVFANIHALKNER